MSRPVQWTVARGDDSFPDCLLELGAEAPSELYGLGPPELLAGIEPEHAVTIVGSRRSGGYGLGVARDLGFGAAAAGLVVVSGLALGCDSAAHEGALDADGSTIAVLGGGVDVPSPPSRERLYRRILAAGGLILSEYPPGTRPHRESFPARNRIMAALSGVTVVVEAAIRSGTRHTADRAQQLGRELAAVPGPVTSSLSALPNELIHDGAPMIRDVHDLLDLGIGIGRLDVRGTGPALEPGLERALLAVEAGGATCDAVALAAGLEGSAAAVALARLELMGYVRGDAVGRYSRTALRPPETNGAAQRPT